MGFNERFGELMWPSGVAVDDDAERELTGIATARPGLYQRLVELGISAEDARVIVERQRDIDAVGRAERFRVEESAH